MLATVRVIAAPAKTALAISEQQNHSNPAATCRHHSRSLRQGAEFLPLIQSSTDKATEGNERATARSHQLRGS
jgi:hypothetical protein